MTYFFGGATQCERLLPVTRGRIELGTHRLACHATDAGFVVTAFTHDPAAHETQLRRLLACLPLGGIQWFNLNHAELQLITLSKGKGMQARE